MSEGSDASESAYARDDRGLMYGDGLFETIAIINGRPRHWPEHLERLQRGCERLSLPQPDPEQLEAECLRHADASARAVLKLILTRGSGGRGYRPPDDARPRRIWSLHPWPDYPERHHRDGVRVRICTTRLACNPRLAGIKHLNRLEQVLARAEWDDDSIAEGLVLDHNGRLIEATASNLILMRDGRLYTPWLNECGIAGVMRQRVMQTAAALAIPVHEQPLTLDDLRRADELALCNSLMGIWPVTRVDGLSLSLDSGRPLLSRLTEQLQQQGDI